MKIDITQIAVALIALLSAVITGFLIPWLKSKFNLNQTNINESQRYLFMLIIETAVKAAEQLYNSDQGKEKKQYVLDLLAEQGFNVDDKALDAAIESLVLDLHRQLNPNPVQTTET